MLFALLGVTLAVVTIAVFHAITENAQPQKEHQETSGGESGSSDDRNQDKNREQEAQKKIAKVNAPKKNINKNPVQQIAPIPVPKNKKDKDMAIGGKSSVSNVRSLSGPTMPAKPMRR